MENAPRTRVRGRPTARICLAAAVVVGATLLGLLALTRGFDEAFRLWNIDSYGEPFLDMVTITGAAQSYMEGFDPRIWNPHDPFNRAFNYPRLWYLVFRLGFTDTWRVPLALTVIALFLVAVVTFPGQLETFPAVLLFLSLVSPAVILGIARANTDLFMFALMVLSLVLVHARPAAAMATLPVAVLLKIVPVLRSAEFLANRRNGALGRIALVAILSLLYFRVTWHDRFLHLRPHAKRIRCGVWGICDLRSCPHDRAIPGPPGSAGHRTWRHASSRSDAALGALPYLLACSGASGCGHRLGSEAA